MNLPGENEILESLKQDKFDIFQYDEIIDIHIEKTYDEVSEKYLYQGHLIVTDGINKIKIEMTNIRGDFRFYCGDHLSGFDIEDCSDRGYEFEHRYRLYDFENHDNLNIYCEDLYLSLMCEL